MNRKYETLNNKTGYSKKKKTNENKPNTKKINSNKQNIYNRNMHDTKVINIPKNWSIIEDQIHNKILPLINRKQMTLNKGTG